MHLIKEVNLLWSRLFSHKNARAIERKLRHHFMVYSFKTRPPPFLGYKSLKFNLTASIYSHLGFPFDKLEDEYIQTPLVSYLKAISQRSIGHDSKCPRRWKKTQAWFLPWDLDGQTREEGNNPKWKLTLHNANKDSICLYWKSGQNSRLESFCQSTQSLVDTAQESWKVCRTFHCGWHF